MSESTTDSSSSVMSQTVLSCDVLDKVQPIFLCRRIAGTKTEKAGRDGEKYLATSELHPALKEEFKKGGKYKATAKVDGTCTLVKNNALWKRRDVKAGRDVPATWVQTGGLDNTDKTENGGHLIGFMSLEKGDKWYLDCHVKTETGYDMTKVHILAPSTEENRLVYREIDISELEGHTVEVLGPKFQNNPQKLTMHCVIRHGDIVLKDFPTLEKYVSDEIFDSDPLTDIKKWFAESPQAPFIEGVVIHFESGKLFKIHRHHLDMDWVANNNPPLHDMLL